MIKRILVALSGTPYSASATQHALQLAEAHGAEVTGVTLVNHDALDAREPVPIGGGAAAHDLEVFREKITKERIEEAIAEFEKACADAGKTYSVAREDGSEFERLISLWRYHDLTIVGLRGLFEYGVVHRADDAIINVVRAGVRPILAVGREYRQVRRAIVAYNGSREAAMAMKRFAQSHPWPNIDLRIVGFGAVAEGHESDLDDAASYCRAHGFNVESARIVDKSPRDALDDEARRWQADVVVMGSTSRGRIARFVLGDTVLSMIQSADVPLFLSR